MSPFILPTFNMVYIVVCGAVAWIGIRQHLLR
jgi:hypothetical protein